MSLIEKIGHVDIEKIKKEIENIKCESQILLQGDSINDNPERLKSRVDKGQVNAWERKQIEQFDPLSITVPLFEAPTINLIMKKYNLYCTRLMTVQPKTCYTYHIDKIKRLHIPIYTNEHNFFIIDDILYRLPADGSIYSVDTTKIHTFVNASMEKRIHIVGML